MDFAFNDVDSLLDRLGNGYEKDREFVFLIGSGVTCPAGLTRGVLGVTEIVNLIRNEFSNSISQPVIQQLNAERARNPISEYQKAFEHLEVRRGQDFVNLIIRQAVLAARMTDDPLAQETKRLKVEEIRSDECRHLCELLEKDIHHWHLRPGIKSLGKILVEFQQSFGNIVLTTNFDPLIKVSAKLAGGTTETWMLHGDAPLSWPSSDSVPCRIIHLHGSWAGDTLHTTFVLEQERPNLDLNLANILSNRTLVVIGYGGWDDVFMKALVNTNRNPDARHNVLWTFFQGSSQWITENNRPFLNRLKGGFGGNRVVFHKGVDADMFFPALLKRLQEIRDGRAHLGSTRLINLPYPPPVLPMPVRQSALSNQPVLPSESGLQQSKLSQEYSLFLSLLKKRSDSVTQLDDLSANERMDVQEPNFLLFEREGDVIMTIAPSSEHIDPYRLQKTTEPQIKSQPLALDRVEKLGFSGGKVHPIFKDQGQEIRRIFWDATLLVQTILFPNSRIALPIYQSDGSERKLLAPIHELLEVLIEWHGRDKIIFANIVDRHRTRADNPILEKLIGEHRFITRFAPTPSSQLHLGNVRTALATYLLSLRNKERSRFYLRFDNTDNMRCQPQLVEEIKEELRWLGLKWDETTDTFEQDTKAASKKYKSLLQVLELADFTERGKRNAVTLKSLPVEEYYCVYYDRREGAIVTHQPPLTKRGSVFTRADLKDPLSLVNKLSKKQSPLSNYLWEKFSVTAQTKLSAGIDSSPLPTPLQDTLIEELNLILAGPCIFEKKLFAQVKLNNKTRELVEDSLRDEDLGLLNRMLLEDAYPRELGKKARRYKKIDLRRGNDENAFYRFAGLVDDIRCLHDKEHLTWVLRDNRQMELTQVQAHIRFALELARQKLTSNRQAQQLFLAAGLNPKKSIPVPLYFHLPFVTDNGKFATPIMRHGKAVPRYTILRKRKMGEEDLDNYMVSYLRYRKHMLPESIVAYLVATIIPPRSTDQSWKKHLASIAFIFSQLGVYGGLQFFSRSFTLDDLVKRQKPIRCEPRHLWFAEQLIIKKLAAWRLQQKLKNEGDETWESLPRATQEFFIGAFAENSAEFANYAQILSMIKKPHDKNPLSETTRALIGEVSRNRKSDAEIVQGINAEIERRRKDLRDLSNGERKQQKSNLFQLLEELRFVLVGQQSSPKIGPLMAILGDEETASRIKTRMTGRKA